MPELIEGLDFNNVNVNVTVDRFCDQCPHCRRKSPVRYLGWYLNGDEAQSKMLQQVCRCRLPDCGRLWVAVYQREAEGHYALSDAPENC